MNHNHYRTDHGFWRPADPENVFYVRTFEQARHGSAARRIGQLLALQVAKKQDQSFEYMQGFTMPVPGVTKLRPPETVQHGRWRNAALLSESDVLPLQGLPK